MNFFNNFKKHRVNVLIVGSNGMLGRTMMEKFTLESRRKDSVINVVHGVDFPEFDVADRAAVNVFFIKSIHYDYCINCAAITNTRDIESTLTDQSFGVNALGPRYLAEACSMTKTKLIHISTDYVFSENSIYEIAKMPGEHKRIKLFDRSSTEFPVNTYGVHKLVGELFVKNAMNEKDYAILRVSWLYGKYNNKSFVHRFLKNCLDAAKKTDGEAVVKCVDDEYSFPTSCDNVFKRAMNVILYGLYGVHIACDLRPTAAESELRAVSRYDFCAQILADYIDAGFDSEEMRRVRLEPVHSAENGGMRYPKESAMYSSYSDPLNTDTLNYAAALREFMFENGREIKKWLDSRV